MLGSTVRVIGSNCLGFYKPLYFQNIYPENQDFFAVGNAACYLLAGAVGAIYAGRLSDKLEDDYPLSKSWIAAGSTAIALPFMTLCLTYQDNFWVSFALMWGHYCFSEWWISPATVMLQNTTSTKNQGFAVGIYNLGLSASALVGSVGLGKI